MSVAAPKIGDTLGVVAYNGWHERRSNKIVKTMVSCIMPLIVNIICTHVRAMQDKICPFRCNYSNNGKSNMHNIL